MKHSKEVRAASVGRALDHHQGRGIIRSWRMMEDPRRREWVVDLYMVGWKTYSISQAEALCDALAAASGWEVASASQPGVLDLDWRQLARTITALHGDRLMELAGEIETPEEDLIVEAISEAIALRDSAARRGESP